MIETSILVACGIHPTQAKMFSPHIWVAFERYKISTREQQAAFIAQAMHESANFSRLEESTYYSRPETIFSTFKRLQHLGVDGLAKYCKNPVAFANLAYAGVNGNGSVESGDGWRYRGRGLFQLTGRSNYAAASAAINRDYVGRPELVAVPSDAALTAGWFWSTHGLNALVAAGDIDAVSRKINGGTNGMLERSHLYHDCLGALA